MIGLMIEGFAPTGRDGEKGGHLDQKSRLCKAFFSQMNHTLFAPFHKWAAIDLFGECL
jgi:hypothetical protein|tara:strand:- start:292 stop:465 length:174 start_codon:yes stop_codon:yes gene_type:complete